MSKENFRKGLEYLINSESMENGSDTPDFMLADYLMSCLELYNKTVKTRERWYGRNSWGDASNDAEVACEVPTYISELPDKITEGK